LILRTVVILRKIERARHFLRTYIQDFRHKKKKYARVFNHCRMYVFQTLYLYEVD
jgi:hypothetical protein